MYKNTIQLLPHNDMLYKEIRQHISNGDRSIFYSEATGLGKSFIFMKLVQDYFEGKKILYIVPKIAIWDNLVHYKEFSQLDAQIEMKTFTAFNRYDSKDKLYEKYDVVFVDECHHMLSDIQGTNVAIFLEDMYNAGKFTFGMTATPKYNDVYVDEMYFNVSCYGYDVFEAIANNIFPKIDIAVANIDFDAIPADLRKKYSISGTKSILEQIIEERSDISHWLAYFSTQEDLEDNENELRALFPNFEIVKLYYECGNASDVINYFENYEGNIILMSVSMLLEGMHLDNVGGILLYRNVIRTHTYFQIYGRLCRIGLKKSPLFLDVTNSVFNIKDCSMFKSSRCIINHEYNMRDLFDVTSKTYRYVELADDMNPFIEKEYRGVVWTSPASLESVMHQPRSSVSKFLGQFPDKTIYDYIDSRLKHCTLDEFINNGYKVLYSCMINGVEYKYENYKDLGRQVGRPFVTTGKGDVALDAYIKLVEWESLNGFMPKLKYRGFDISSLSSLSNCIGISSTTLKSFITIEKVTAKDCVDMCLDDDKKYKGICLVRAIDELSEMFGVNRFNPANMFNNYKSMKKVIDYYIPDSKVYRGIEIGASSTKRDIADKLGVNVATLSAYMLRKKCSMEECIDYYLDEQDNKDMDPLEGWEQRNYPNSYTREEFEIMQSMRKDGYEWSDIAEALNKLQCNINRGIVRTRASVSSIYTTSLRKGHKRNQCTNPKGYEPEEDALILELRSNGFNWDYISNKVNELDCNISREITRTNNAVNTRFKKIRAKSIE